MRTVLPYIFWPWFAISCAVLMHRKFSTGSFRPGGSGADSPIPPSTATTDEPAATRRTFAAPTGATTPLRPTAVSTRTLADALEGIAMPCDLAPLTGTTGGDPHKVAFFTEGSEAAAVGEALADELERLGYSITPTDDRSIAAVRGDDEITARLVSAVLDSPAVMREHHPSAPADALVVELALR